jgi:type II secretory pathway component GspD/PulD (secretin)
MNQLKDHTMRFRFTSIARVITVLLSLTLMPSQTLFAQTAPAPTGDLVTMNMRDAEIRTLIQWIADQTGKNMVVHRDVQGKATRRIESFYRCCMSTGSRRSKRMRQ